MKIYPIKIFIYWRIFKTTITARAWALGLQFHLRIFIQNAFQWILITMYVLLKGNYENNKSYKPIEGKEDL